MKKIDFTATNLNINGGNSNVYVVNAKGKKQLLTSLKVSKDGKTYKFSFKYSKNYGKHNNKEHDNNYIYASIQ